MTDFPSIQPPALATKYIASNGTQWDTYEEALREETSYKVVRAIAAIYYPDCDMASVAEALLDPNHPLFKLIMEAQLILSSAGEPKVDVEPEGEPFSLDSLFSTSTEPNQE